MPIHDMLSTCSQSLVGNPYVFPTGSAASALFAVKGALDATARLVHMARAYNEDIKDIDDIVQSWMQH
jgi:hypothetical protein